MKDLLDKITSYNLFNYLLPGVVFAALAKYVSHFNLVQDDIIVGAFVYYFIGLVISRIGSLILDPILMKFNLVKFAAYEEYISVSKIDTTLEVLSEVNNTYRTLSALFVLLAVLKIYELLSKRFQDLESVTPFIIFGTLFILFILSYRKQTQFIVKRISAGKK
jgi:hypothetical protein